MSGKKQPDADNEEEQTPKVLKENKFTSSALSVKTLDLYDPYETREGMGHLSNFQAWAHLVKCSFGTGVLTMPKGFQHAGLVPGLFLGCFFGAMCIYCMQILIKSCVHIAARHRVPYIPLDKSMEYTFLNGYPACKFVSKCIKGFTDAILVAYHFGICIAYVNYMAQTTLRIFGYAENAEGYNWPTVVSIAVWLPFLCPINCVRNLRMLAPVSIIGNALTAVSMVIIMYYIFTPDPVKGLISDSWTLFGRAQTVPLYIGIILFAVEAFGVVIAVERDMKKPKQFLGWCGVFNSAMILVLGWYIFLGASGYLRFGSDVESTISMTIPPEHWLSTTMYVMLALSLFCSYPLHCFVCIDILWNKKILPKVSSNPVLYEVLFRCGAVLVSGFCALLIPKLDVLVSLIGAVCLSFLGIMMPGIMEYNVAWSKFGMQWSCTMVKDIFIVILGLISFIVGTYGVIYTIIVPDEHDHERAHIGTTVAYP